MHATATAWLDSIAPQRAIAYERITRFRSKAGDGIQCDVSPTRLEDIAQIDNQSFANALAQQPMWLLGASLSGNADNKEVNGGHAQLIVRCASERARQRGIKLADIDAQALRSATQQWTFGQIEPPLVALSHWVKIRGDQTLNEALWAAMIQAEHHWTNRASGGGKDEKGEGASKDAVAEIENVGPQNKEGSRRNRRGSWKCLRNLEGAHDGAEDEGANACTSARNARTHARSMEHRKRATETQDTM